MVTQTSSSTPLRARLREARKQKGTQRKVAADLGITETYLRAIEHGTYLPSIRIMKRMEHYFGVPLDELFPELNDPSFYLSDS
ncbi:helix-turn-helix transcriptional regulator [Alicyclobacillus sendaiensis]|uniref:helix-turn-helix transcriptional regulator n=1 Tax=Alicyclobacillus sendaiensis TaxID=192387 RepID=UPI0009F8EB5B